MFGNIFGTCVQEFWLQELLIFFLGKCEERAVGGGGGGYIRINIVFKFEDKLMCLNI